MSFERFNLSEEVLNGLRDMGFEKPTPVQESCIPIILQGRDVLGSAQTGTGKTAAFAIPVLEKLLEKKKKNESGIRALIITPTRELAGQVDEAFFAIGYHTGLTTAKVYGGDDWSRQEKALNKGTHIIVATPGRLLDHMKIHDVDFSRLDFLILDEADRMLDMGFIPDITQIVSQLPKDRQTLLFSATMPPKIVQLAQKMMRNPERINMAPPNKAAEGVRQRMYYIEERSKRDLVLYLFEKEQWTSAIIFMSTKRGVDQLTRELARKGASVTSIHGDRSQSDREKALESFRKGDFRIIVATDVMSRGIDVEGISHIVNFSVPHDVEDYVHRIGRTARAEKTGDAITLISGQDRRYMENIIREMESEILKMEVPDLKNTDSKAAGKSKPPTRSRKDAHRSPANTDSLETRAADSEKEDSKTKKAETAAQEETPERPPRRRGRRRPGPHRRARSGKQKTAEQDADDTGRSPDHSKTQDMPSKGKDLQRDSEGAGDRRPKGNEKTFRQTDRSRRQTRKKSFKSEERPPQTEKRSSQTGDESPQTREGSRQTRASKEKTGDESPQTREGSRQTRAKTRASKEKAGDESRKKRPVGQRKGKRGSQKKVSSREEPPTEPGVAKQKEVDRKRKPRPGRKKSTTQRNADPSTSVSREDRLRKELFENIASPDMEMVNKAVKKKSGIWGKVKNLFGR